MSKKYNTWLNEMAESESADLQSIANVAKRSAWTVWAVIECKDHSIDGINAAILRDTGDEINCYEFEEDMKAAIKEGWISLHGDYIALWQDAPAD